MWVFFMIFIKLIFHINEYYFILNILSKIHENYFKKHYIVHNSKNKLHELIKLQSCKE